jgi:hypothetical protein
MLNELIHVNDVGLSSSHTRVLTNTPPLTLVAEGEGPRGNHWMCRG